MSKIPTPHISAAPGDFADTVLMPGDPLRSRFIAENFLTDARLVNDVRGVQGYTGFYHGKRVSVMASGMGSASIGIYSYELFNFYDVKNIIRIGSAGMLNRSLNLMDIVVGLSCYTNSRYGDQFGIFGHMAPCCSYKLLEKAMKSAEKLGYRMFPGPLYSSDIFYDEQDHNEALQKLGVLAVEMEGSTLYLNAARAGKNALCICTISDDPLTGRGLSSAERQTSFRKMIEIGLETA